MTFDGFHGAPLIEDAGFSPDMLGIPAPEAATLDAALREAARAERAEATLLDLWLHRPGGANLQTLELPASALATSRHAWAAMSDDGNILDLPAGKGMPLFAAYGDDEEIVVVGPNENPNEMDEDNDGNMGGSGAGFYPGFGQGGGVAEGAEGALISLGPEGSWADIWVKNGADISNLSPEMKATFAKIIAAFTALGLPHPVITSGRDGDHQVGSLHYQGQAIDLRGNNITDAQGNALENYLSNSLGANYDVLFETFTNAERDHIHIEFDPD